MLEVIQIGLILATIMASAGVFEPKVGPCGKLDKLFKDKEVIRCEKVDDRYIPYCYSDKALKVLPCIDILKREESEDE